MASTRRLFVKEGYILYVAIPRKNINDVDILGLFDEYRVQYICFGNSSKLFRKEDFNNELNM